MAMPTLLPFRPRTHVTAAPRTVCCWCDGQIKPGDPKLPASHGLHVGLCLAEWRVWARNPGGVVQPRTGRRA
jgi:hypothetical protein